MSLDIDARQFHVRAARLAAALRRAPAQFGDATGLAFAHGARDPAALYLKVVAVQTWLLGYECPETVLVLELGDGDDDEPTVHICASKKKLALLAPVAAARPADVAGVRVTLHERAKKADNAALYAALLAKAGARVGTLAGELAQTVASESATRGVLHAFVAQLERESAAWVAVDAAPGVARVLARKDERERALAAAAGAAAAHLFKRLLRKPMEAALEEDDARRVPTHAALAAGAEAVLVSAAALGKQRLPAGADDVALIEPAFVPIIQSGGAYDLKPSAVASDAPLDPGVILCSLGVRYQSYCASVSRTYFIDPEPRHSTAYEAVLRAYDAALAHMVPGATLGSVYDAVRDALAAADDALAGGMLRTIGFGTGIEFRESLLALKSGNSETFEAGQTYCLRVGVRVSADFSILLADTVQIEAGGGGAKLLTGNVPRKLSQVSYDLAADDADDEADAAAVAAKQKKKSELKEKMRQKLAELDDQTTSGYKTRRSQRQRENIEEQMQSAEAIEERQRHQRELHDAMQERALQRLTKGDEQESTVPLKAPKDFRAYKKSIDMPREASKVRIAVDRRAMAVLVPICGFIVPLHVSTIKNVINSESYLRLQFITPISVIPKDPATKIFQDKQKAFIKEAAWRVADEQRLATTFRLIKELRKQFTSEQTQQRNAASIKEQPNLELARQRPIRLTDVFMRPSLTRGKTSGTLESHSNGFRFRSDKGGKLDIIYANIKHAIFQPAKNELITVVHFHLFNDILVNKKKCRDIQFYTEVMEASQTLEGAGRFQAYDGIEEERRERIMRNKINSTFSQFAKKVSEGVPDLEFETPYRELGFHGAPNKSNVLLQPTVHCLINITEAPFFVLSLSEVDFVHMERVHFNNRSFDMVVVFKDYTKPPVVLRSIERDKLDAIRDWLDSVNLPFTEGSMTFNWPLLLKRAREDPVTFFGVEGGWKFLNPQSDDEGEDGDDSSSSEPGEEAFVPKEEELQVEDESFEDSEFDEDDDEDDDEDEDESSGEDEEDALSWDELERKTKAQEKSRKRHRDDESD